MIKAANQHFTEADFQPQLTPQEMLELGVFGGSYFGKDHSEFPASWFEKAQLSNNGFNVDCNHFRVAAGQTRAEWQAKGWITQEDPLGWFQWYCRFTMGRRLPGVDSFQIGRWRALAILAELEPIANRVISGVARGSDKRSYSGPTIPSFRA
jgi:hypothetical protein